MLGKLAKAIAISTLAGGSLVLSAGGASAAHCVETDEPGFSYFGNDHVAEDSDHANEGRGQHMGAPGASSCRDTTGSPSERAPGKP